MGTRTVEPSISESEYQRKIEELQALVQEGIDDLDKGNYTEFNSPEELHTFMMGLMKEIDAEFEAELDIA